MMEHNSLIAAAAIAAAAFCSACSEQNPVLTVEGGRIQGVTAETAGITIYKGIPYAAPPVGDLRWKEPQPVVAWEGVKIADTFGAPSVQGKHTPGGYTPEFFFDGDPEYSEDCLYLNVWTPAAGKTCKKLPVCLWIHGGGYMAGWGHEPEMDGEEWAKHGVVLVTFNYRLGLLGFLTHPELSAESPHGVSGNYGMLDQIAALKWVKNNIAQFGGDPDRITVMGQSAGAMSVQTLVSSPLSRDLIAGAIIQSGGGITPRALLGGTPLAESEEGGKTLMDWAGYDSLEKMRAASAEDLTGIAFKYMIENRKFLSCGTSPVIDGYALEKPFGEAALAGEISDVPYLIGGTLDDMQGLADGITRFCVEREKAGGDAYSYQFARRLPTDGRPDVLEGAFHSSELWYTFKSLKHCWRPFTEGDYALAEQIITYWTNFVKYGNPNGPKGGAWTPCTEASPQSMVLCLDENDSPACHMQYIAAPLTRAESGDALDAAFEQYLACVDTAEAAGQVLMQSIMVIKDGKVLKEKWMNGGTPDSTHVMFSVSKTFTSTAVGFAINEGLLKLDDKLVDLMPDKLPESVSENLSAVTVRDLLTMSCGHVKDPTYDCWKYPDADWIEFFCSRPFEKAPGTYYCYNSLGTYVLSAIVQKITGQKVFDYLQPRLFEPLGISGIHWEESPAGINCGGWGLYLKTEDMARMGLCLLQGGKFAGRQVIPADWVAEMGRKQVECVPAGLSPEKAAELGLTPESSDWVQGYGYQMWRCRHNAFRADGANGQYILVIPDKNAVIAATADSRNLQLELDLIWDNIYPVL